MVAPAVDAANRQPPGTPAPRAMRWHPKARPSPEARERARLAATLAHHLSIRGWRIHTHTTDIWRARPESTPLPGIRDDPECIAVVQRIQALLDATCERAPPDLKVIPTDWPTDDQGRIRWQWKDHRRPAEFSPTYTHNDERGATMWRTIVTELASNWARCDVDALSIGLAFLGPRDRFVFWPRELNELLMYVRCAYGRVHDLFLVAAICGVNLDLKAAYRRVGINPDDAAYHAAAVDGLIVTFLQLSFGSAQSPAAFCAFLDATLRRFRQSMPNLVAALYQFVDDSNLSATRPLKCLETTERLVIALVTDGWWLSPPKTYALPSDPLYATGVSAHLAARSVSIHESKCRKALELLSAVTRPLDDAIQQAADSRDPILDLSLFLDQPRVSCIAVLPVGPGGLRCGVAYVHVKLETTPPELAVGIATPALRRSTPATRVHEDIMTALDSDPRPRATIVTCPSAAIAYDIAAGLPDATRPTAICLAYPRSEIPTRLPPATWFDPIDLIPADVQLRRRRPLPGTVAFSAPEQSGTRLSITATEFHAIQRVVGYLAYFQGVLAFIGYWRTALAPLAKYGHWTPDCAAAFDSVYALLHVAHQWEADVDVAGPVLDIIPDAGASCWGSSAPLPDGRIVYRTGVLAPADRGTSSTHREACGARDGSRAALAAWKGPLGALRIRPDNSPLIGVAAGRGRNPGTSRIMMTFAAWAVQGLPVLWEHQGREHADHKAPDALAASSPPRPWALRAPVAKQLWETLGGWSLHLGGTEDSVLGTPSYATFSSHHVTGSERLAVLTGLAPTLLDSSGRTRGWVGTVDSVQLQPREQALATPLWSEIHSLVGWWQRQAHGSLLVIAPLRSAGDWWDPALESLRSLAAEVIELPPRSTDPPTPGASRDPRPLACYLLTGDHPRPPLPPPPCPWSTSICRCSHCSDIHFRADPASAASPADRGKHHPAWTVTCLCACGDVHPNPGPPMLPASDPFAILARTVPAPPSLQPTPGEPRPTLALPPQDPFAILAGSRCSTAPHAPAPQPAPPPSRPTMPRAPARPPPPPQPPPARPAAPATSSQAAAAAAHARPRPRADPFDILAASGPPAARAPATARQPASTGEPRACAHRDCIAQADCPDDCPHCPAHCPDPATCTVSRHLCRFYRERARTRPNADARCPDSPAAPRRTAAPVTAATATGPERCTDHAAGAGVAASSAPPPAETAPASASASASCPYPSLTVGAWVTEMLRAHGGAPIARLPAGVASAHRAALDEHRRATTTKANAGSSAPVRCCKLLLAFARHRRVLDTPWSLAQVDALVLDFIQARRKPLKAIPDWGRGIGAPAARGVASTIAAASARAGYPLPQYCGPLCDSWSAATGGKAKPEHSAAWPLHLRFLLDAEPARSDPTWTAWAGLILMSVFCLRTGVVQHLHRHMFVPYDGGYILVWRHTQKRSGVVDDATNPDHLSKVGSISAARHPALTRILGDTSVGDNSRVLPDLDADDMSAFVKRHVPGAPQGFDVRVYGARVAADSDATELALPAAEAAVMFWWKRGDLGMRHYYSGVNIRRLFLFSERRGAVSYSHLFKGRYDAVIPSADLRQWDSAAVGASLPTPPSWAVIARAMEATSPSLIAAVAVRTQVRRVRARRAAGDDSTSSAPSGVVDDVMTGACADCGTAIGPDDDAAICTRCRLMSCTRCTPDLDADYRCPAHRPKPRRPAAKRRTKR